MTFALDVANLQSPLEGVPDQTGRGCGQCGREWFEDMSRPAATEPEHEECSEDGCTERVYPENPYFSSPCGTYCTEHMRLHVKTCEICRNEFPAATPDEDEQNGESAGRIIDLSADPEGMNDDRAKWAQVALDAFQGETGTDDGDRLADLLCDLMHWANRNGMGFAYELQTGRAELPGRGKRRSRPSRRKPTSRGHARTIATLGEAGRRRTNKIEIDSTART